VREVFISFAVFVFCVSLTLFSQFNSDYLVEKDKKCQFS